MPLPMTFMDVYDTAKIRFMGRKATPQELEALRGFLVAGWIRVAADQGFDFDPQAVAVTVSKGALRKASGHAVVTVHRSVVEQFAARMTAEERERFYATAMTGEWSDE